MGSWRASWGWLPFGKRSLKEESGTEVEDLGIPPPSETPLGILGTEAGVACKHNQGLPSSRWQLHLSVRQLVFGSHFRMRGRN